MSPYDIIYADPPWAYRNKKTGGSMVSGAEAKYPTMSVDEISALPIKDIASKNSVLFMWATVPLMPEAFQVMKAWGYKYKTMITWRKIMSLGMGYWFRGQCEHLLLGVRGQVKAFRLQEPNFIQAKVLAHSEKPEEFRQLIERATSKMPSRNAVELFARRSVAGWDVFGNQVEGSIRLPTKHAPDRWDSPALNHYPRPKFTPPSSMSLRPPPAGNAAVSPQRAKESDSMKLHLITYGCGKQFDIAKFKPVKNKSFVKPEGGLWSSPVNSNYGWREWCKSESFGNLSHHFKFQFEGNVFVIDGCADAARMPWLTFYGSIKYPDFEKMVSLGYDAIWLTEKGQQETRFGEPSLYGWDCESVLVMNPSGVLTTACTGQRGFSPSTSLVSG